MCCHPSSHPVSSKYGELAEDNVYLAAWLALPVTLIVAVIQGIGKPKAAQTQSVWPLKKIIVYMLFFICFPLMLTPWMQDGSRTVCGIACVPLFLIIVLTTNETGKSEFTARAQRNPTPTPQ